MEAPALGLRVVANELPGMREAELPACEKRLTDGIVRQVERSKLLPGVGSLGWD